MDDTSIGRREMCAVQRHICCRITGLTLEVSSQGQIFCRYQPKRDITFLPMSGLLGNNIIEPIPKSSCPWYSGPTLFQVSH